MKLSEVISGKETAKHVLLEFQSALLEEWPDLDVNLSVGKHGMLSLKTKWDDIQVFGISPSLDLVAYDVSTGAGSMLNASAKFWMPNVVGSNDYRMDDGGIKTFLPTRLMSGSQECHCEGWRDVAGRFAHELKEVLKRYSATHK